MRSRLARRYRVLPGILRLRRRNRVRISGQPGAPVVFAHGYGCGQNMGPLTQPALEARKQDERATAYPR
jgi:hypothetical protein